MSQIYSKDSFDRFGDDLCEVLLSYLSFSHRFRYECLSKQWQRFVFNTQTELYINLNYCKIILKKCPNIQHIYLDSRIDNSKFSLIIKHCNHLNTIYINS